MAKRNKPVVRTGSADLRRAFARFKLDRTAADWSVLHAWHRLAGPRLQRHTRAERMLGTTLIVRVATAPWANELSFLRAELLTRLRADPAAAAVSELRFSIGPLAELADFDAADPRGDGARAPAVVAPAIDAGAVAQALLAVGDPELRAALAELFARARSGV